LEQTDLHGEVTDTLFGALVAAVDFGVAVCDMRLPDQPMVRVNAALERLTGYGAGDLIGRNCRMLQGTGTSPLVKDIMRDAIARHTAITITVLNYRADGSSFWNEIRLIPLMPVDGRATFYAGLMTDVSERVEAEVSVGHAEVLRSVAFNSMINGVVVLDSTGTVSDANTGALRILGATREDLASGDWWARLNFRHPDGRPVTASESLGLRALRTRSPILDTRRLLRRGDGADRLVSISYEPIGGHAGADPQGLVISFQDVTDRERSDIDLQEFASLVAISSDFIAIAALDGSIKYLNPAGRRLIGLESLEQARTSSIRDFLTTQGWDDSVNIEQPAVNEHGEWQGESTLRHFVTGTVIPVRINSYLVRHPETREPVALATVQRDISVEKKATADLLRSRERYQAQFRSLPVPTYVWRREEDDFVLLEWNTAAENLPTYDLKGLQGMRARDVLADDPETRLALERCWSSGEQTSREQTLPGSETGESRQIVFTYASVPPDLVLVHALDITERVESERLLKRLAEEDELTDLHNRRFFERELGDALGSRPAAVAFVDIDHFKFVNDSFGHDAGDELLRQTAALMASQLGDGDVCARLGGDEFAVLFASADEEQVSAAVHRLLAEIRSNSRGASVTASAGVALFPAGVSVSASDAMIASDIALYDAKQQGRDRVEFYRGAAGENLAWVQLVRDAIAHERLLLVAQPIVDLRDQDARPRFELLVRLKTDTGKILPPTAFLPAAEQFGLMRDLDRWVISHAIAFAANGMEIGINVSARSIGDPGLPGFIAEQIRKSGARAQDLIFEITETAAISSINDARTFTDALNAMGCAVALDDFGTGFGTFLLLRHLTVRYLKIDLEFVRRLTIDAEDQRIVRLIVHIAREAGMQTVAEGVEDAETLALLREYGVDRAQGFHIAAPGPLPASA
jgi:diguanylate cyclase (GGDEF)-like protein/PAS domain S-box-containing protein